MSCLSFDGEAARTYEEPQRNTKQQAFQNCLERLEGRCAWRYGARNHLAGF